MSISLEIKNNKKLLVAFLSLLLLSVFSLKIVNAKSDDTKIYIDVPYSTQQVDGKLNYQGWVMSENKNAKVKVYVDGEEQDEPIRYLREDVLSAITGYGGRTTNSKPGFKGSIDVSSYALGSSHTFKVDVLVNSKVVETMSTTFKIGTPSTKIEIDKPVQNQSVKTTLDIEGWVMSEDSGASVEIYVDGSKVSTASRYEREDVLSAISGYGGRTTNSKPGFRTTLDMSKYTDGAHNIEMKVISSGGNIISTCNRVVNVKKYDTQIYIDVPYSTQQVDGKLNYQGWVMSEAKDAKVKVYVDGEEQSNPTRYLREDVLNAISGYGGRTTNSKPGFKGSIDVSSYPLGSSHTFKVEVEVNNEVVETMSTTFKIGTPSTKLEIDKPVQNQSVKTTLDIEGWVMSEDSGASVEIYVDGSKVSTTTRYVREDVLSAISGYGGRTTNSKPGFRTTIDMSKYTDGAHNIEMKVISSGGNIISTCNRVVNVKKYDTQIYIDVPYSTQQVDGKLNYQGWVMSEAKDAKVKVYVDGEEQSNPTRYLREDVLNAISGYGGRTTNSKPGFKGSIDVSSYPLGSSHTFKVEVEVNNEVIESMSTTFKISAPSTKLEIDKPVQNQSVKTTLDIEGWVMSEDSGASVEIYVDGSKVSTASRYEREDVLSAISGYGGRTTNSKPGFRTTLDMSKYTDGAHNIEMKVISSGGNIISTCSRVVNVKKYDTKIEIESPINESFFKENIEYYGWVMSEDKNATLKVYVDDVEQNTPTRYEREDVLNAISGYGGKTTNSKPGYKGSIDYNNISEGYHTLKIEAIASITGEVITSVSTQFYLRKYSTKIEIESPVTNSTKKTSIDIKGWIMSEDKDGSIEIYIDNEKMDTTSLVRTEREDVLNSVIGYGDASTNPNPGYEMTIDSSEMNDGLHNYKIVYVSSESSDVTTSVSSNFYIKKYDGMIYLDDPVGTNFSSNFTIRGWAMAECSNSRLEVYLDNNLLSVERTERQDVIDSVKDYGTALENPTPGFITTLDIANYSEGMHTITIKLYSFKNELIDSYEKRISISKGRYFGVDVSEHNGYINWSYMRSAGIDYAYIRAGIRGYTEGKIVNDDNVYTNLDGCLSSGIKCGVYFFSQAINYSEGVEEADFIINLLENSNYHTRISLPIAIDTEWSNNNHDGRADFLTKLQRTEAVKGFIDEVAARNYRPMIYASTDWFNNKLDMSQLGNADIWVADWRGYNGYQGPYQVWQYGGGDGPSYGVSSEGIDLNYFYKKY